MAIIKCKMCGGDIEISADKTFGTCEYCGSTMTLPKVDDEQRAAAFNRGNHFRRSGEFDKALAVYERIVAEDDNDAEAHWCCALCRFGIEYVEDPATYEWLPTCHRASFDSFLEDVDYLAAVEHSDGITRRQYQKDAAKIAEVQRGILATSQNEQPFDVFLCYKETGEDGRRTRDSLMAQEVYYELTEQGYRVFFARITLEDKAGTEYEPYIFAALNSAKVMVVIGTKPEHFNAVWVKNEWSRFLSMMKKDRSKLLLPCYRDMDPYDLPEALSVLQSYDMSKIGFMQDLIRGIKKVIDAGKPQEAAKETVKETVVVHNEGGSNVQALLKRGNMALEDGEWSKADEFFEQVLNQDAECGAAYLGKFLAKEKFPSTQKYAASYVEQVKNAAPTGKNAEACAEDKAFIEACIQKYQVADYYPAQEIRKALQFDRRYCADHAEYFRNSQKRAEQLLDTDRNFARAEKYASGETKAQCGALRSALADALRQQEQTAEQEAAAEKQRITEAYHTFLKETEPKLAAAKKEALTEKQKDEEAAERARIEQREREEKERIEREEREEKERIEREKAEQEAKEKAAKADKITRIVLGVAAAVIAVVLLITKVIIPSSNYSKAEELLAAGDYDGAITVFEKVGSYKDAAERKKYYEAELFLQEGDTAHAAISFGEIADYQDARERSMALWDTIAVRKTLAASTATESGYTIVLKTNGTVGAAGKCDGKPCNVAGWGDIIAVEAGSEHIVGLKADGTVVAVGSNEKGQCDVSDWTDIVAISAGYSHTVGLKADGTVVAVGNNYRGRCNVSDWTDIVAISAAHHTVGLKADGTVVAVGNNDDGECDVSSWTDIVAISAGSSHTVGLKADGTVVAVGCEYDSRCDVSDWRDIVAISAGGIYTVGLKADGTVVAVGYNYDGRCDVSNWADIVAISAGWDHTVGLKADGSIVAVGDNESGQCNVSWWTDIKVPNK